MDGGASQVPLEDSPGKAAVPPTASALRDELAMSGQRLLAASGQIRMAAHTLGATDLGSHRRRTNS